MPEETRTANPKADKPPGRWFAVLLLNYNDRDSFWDRDAGLFFEGFRANGVDTRFVALGDPIHREDKGLILASQKQMEDPDWWRQWELQGVVLYSWALPRFTGIAKAIHDAGVFLVLLVDADGCRRPERPLSRYIQVKSIYAKMEGRWFPRTLALIKTLAALPKWRYTHALDHLEFADRIALPSPLGKQRFARFLIDCDRPHLVEKLVLVHHPVQSFMVHNPAVAKEPMILAVGSWQRLVKGAELLVKVLVQVLERQSSYSARIIGSGDYEVRRLLAEVSPRIRERIILTGPLPNKELVPQYQAAQIIVNTSYSESFGIAAAEALCCGCSMVGLAALSSFNYFCSEASGTLASQRTVGHYCDALLAETEAWRAGQRNPAKISQTWIQRFHADRIVREVLALRSCGKLP